MFSPPGPYALASEVQASTASSQRPCTPDLNMHISKEPASFAVDPGPGQGHREVCVRLGFCIPNKGDLCLSTSRKDMGCRRL